MVLTPEETRGVWSLIPACATPDADGAEARDTVDCDKLAAMVERLIKAGVNGTGTTSLNTRRTIEKTRWAVDAGADGVLNGVPMWLQPSWQNAVQFYKDIAEAVPNASVMVYHNPP